MIRAAFLGLAEGLIANVKSTTEMEVRSGLGSFERAAAKLAEAAVQASAVSEAAAAASVALRSASDARSTASTQATSFVDTVVAELNRRNASVGAQGAAPSQRPLRYIVGAPALQKHAGPAVKEEMRQIEEVLKPSILRTAETDGTKVMEMLPLEAEILRERFRGLSIEPDIKHQLTRSPMFPPIEPIAVPASAGSTLEVRVQASGMPVSNARVTLLPRRNEQRGYELRTDAQGRAMLRVRHSSVERVIVEPARGFWSRVWEDIALSPILTLEVSALQINGFDWGQLFLQAPSRGNNTGKGVKVAVIDSGIGKHPSLHVAGGKNFLQGENENDWHLDFDGHGTHCAGVIAALSQAASTWGYAPEVELYALRVFGEHDGGFSSDVGAAIEWATNADCDVISMSLGSQEPSGYVRKKIDEANDRGVLCVAATGNNASTVNYPARFRGVLGVAAIGDGTTYPRDSMHVWAESGIVSADGRYYLASFSNFGEDDVDFCAPGVAVTSTLPFLQGESASDAAFGPWDGTSMACPHLAGLAAIALSSPSLANMARSVERRDLVIERLLRAAVDLGMGRKFIGAGVPTVQRLLAT